MAILTNLLYGALGIVFGLLMNWYREWSYQQHPPKVRESTSRQRLATGMMALVGTLFCVWVGTMIPWGWPYMFGYVCAFAYGERIRCARQ